MDEEDDHSPSEVQYYPEDLETFRHRPKHKQEDGY